MHFMIFLIDVIVLSRGQMQWQSMLPELVYFLIISTAMVRWFPVRRKETKETKETEETEETEDSLDSLDSSDS